MLTLSTLCDMILIMKSKTYHHGNLKEALISAGLETLSEQGVEGLSLRNVAKKIGVSHTAPYNHFPDKQALLAAISTAAHEQLHQIILDAFEKSKNTPAIIIPDVAWAYLQFALNNPSKFKLMFSGALEEETRHPDFVAISQKSIALLEEIIVFCQKAGQLDSGGIEMNAIRLWSLVHGFTYLVLENQFPEKYSKGDNLRNLLNSIVL